MASKAFLGVLMPKEGGAVPDHYPAMISVACQACEAYISDLNGHMTGAQVPLAGHLHICPDKCHRHEH